VDDLLEEHGADVCRWWVSSLVYDRNIKVAPKLFRRAHSSYQRIRATLRFMAGNLYDLSVDEPGTGSPAVNNALVPWKEIPATSIDAFVLQQALDLVAPVAADFESYDFRKVRRRLLQFFQETLSELYFPAVRDRLYCDAQDSARRRVTQTAFWHLSSLLSALLAPIIPHTAEETFRSLRRKPEDSIHLHEISDFLFEMHADPLWPKVLVLRGRANNALRRAHGGEIKSGRDAGLVLPDPEGYLSRFEEELPYVLGVSRVEIDPGAKGIAVRDLRRKPLCQRSRRRDSTVALRKGGVWLSDRDYQVVQSRRQREG
jgi:isoleucyl-tRNA synthetase